MWTSFGCARDQAAHDTYIKLRIQRSSHHDEVRRFTAPSSFSQLQHAVEQFWTMPCEPQWTDPGHHRQQQQQQQCAVPFALEYKDSEGDRVRMSSEVEWEECLRLYRLLTPDQLNHPLTLVAVPIAADAAGASWTEPQEENTNATTVIPLTRCHGVTTLKPAVSRTAAVVPLPDILAPTGRKAKQSKRGGPPFAGTGATAADRAAKQFDSIPFISSRDANNTRDLRQAAPPRIKAESSPRAGSSASIAKDQDAQTSETLCALFPSIDADVIKVLLADNRFDVGATVAVLHEFAVKH